MTHLKKGFKGFVKGVADTTKVDWAIVIVKGAPALNRLRKPKSRNRAAITTNAGSFCRGGIRTPNQIALYLRSRYLSILSNP